MNDRYAVWTSPLGWMLAFLAGGLTGAAVALLLAPQSGRATRQMMRRKVNDTAGSARDLEAQLIRRGRAMRTEARHRMDDALSALAGDGGATRPGQGAAGFVRYEVGGSELRDRRDRPGDVGMAEPEGQDCCRLSEWTA